MMPTRRFHAWLDRSQVLLLVILISGAAAFGIWFNFDQARTACEASNENRQALRELINTITESPLVTSERITEYNDLLEKFKDVNCG